MSKSLCPMNCSPPGSSGHGIAKARILEWVVISSSRESSQPRDWTCISCIGRLFTSALSGNPLEIYTYMQIHIIMHIHMKKVNYLLKGALLEQWWQQSGVDWGLCFHILPVSTGDAEHRLLPPGGPLPVVHLPSLLQLFIYLPTKWFIIYHLVCRSHTSDYF